MGCERGHPRACLHAGVLDTFAPGVPINLTGDLHEVELPQCQNSKIFTFLPSKIAKKSENKRTLTSNLKNATAPIS